MGEASRDAVARTHADTLHNRYLQRVAAFGAEGALKWLAAEPSFASITLSSAEPGGWRELSAKYEKSRAELLTYANSSRPSDYEAAYAEGQAAAYREAASDIRALLAPNPPSPENVG